MLVPLALAAWLQAVATDLASSAFDTGVTCGYASRAWWPGWFARTVTVDTRRAHAGRRLKRVEHGCDGSKGRVVVIVVVLMMVMVWYVERSTTASQRNEDARARRSVGA